MVRISIVIVLTLSVCSCVYHGEAVLAEDPSRGSVDRGESLLYSYNCGSCHSIPGVAEANGTVGPPLDGFANQTYVSGLLTNTPENLVRWIVDPQQVDASSAMPKLGVTDEQALDIVAYLYTLQ